MRAVLLYVTNSSPFTNKLRSHLRGAVCYQMAPLYVTSMQLKVAETNSRQNVDEIFEQDRNAVDSRRVHKQYSTPVVLIDSHGMASY